MGCAYLDLCRGCACLRRMEFLSAFLQHSPQVNFRSLPIWGSMKPPQVVYSALVGTIPRPFSLSDCILYEGPGWGRASGKADQRVTGKETEAEEGRPRQCSGCFEGAPPCSCNPSISFRSPPVPRLSTEPNLQLCQWSLNPGLLSALFWLQCTTLALFLLLSQGDLTCDSGGPWTLPLSNPACKDLTPLSAQPKSPSSLLRPRVHDFSLDCV
jgi:hypothetical protein